MGVCRLWPRHSFKVSPGAGAVQLQPAVCMTIDGRLQTGQVSRHSEAPKDQADLPELAAACGRTQSCLSANRFCHSDGAYEILFDPQCP